MPFVNEQRSRIVPCNALRHVRRQVAQPHAVALHHFVVRTPALVDPGVGADQEAPGVLQQQRRHSGHSLPPSQVRPGR
jgi:hypothetical protein